MILLSDFLFIGWKGLVGQPGHNTRRHARLQPKLPGQGCMGDLTSECSFDSQAPWVIDEIDLIFDMIFMVF